MYRFSPSLIFRIVLMAGLAFGWALANPSQAQSRSKHRHTSARSHSAAPAPAKAAAPEGPVIGKRIVLTDGSSIQAEEVVKQGDDYWYRTGGVMQRVAGTVRSIES